MDVPSYDNDRNIDFYNNIGIDNFKSMAVKGGFDGFKDLQIVFPYIKNCSSLVELGAGYGRCLEFLISKDFRGKLIGVEYSPILYQHLATYFDGKATILQQDIKRLKLETPVDAALWMWSGFIDFTQEEQQHTISLLFKNLTEDGKLVLDVPQIGTKTIAEHIDTQHIHYETAYGTLDCYIPSAEDINNYARVAGFVHVENVNYLTDTDKQRSLFILTRN